MGCGRVCPKTQGWIDDFFGAAMVSLKTLVRIEFDKIFRARLAWAAFAASVALAVAAAVVDVAGYYDMPPFVQNA